MRSKLTVLLLVLAALLILATLVSAAPNAFSLPWWSLDGGGGTSQGGDFTLHSTIGQPDAGPRMTGGDFSLQGGFWDAASPSAPINHPIPPTGSPGVIYLPLLPR